MRVLVDTSIWSLALRKKDRTPEEEMVVKSLEEIIRKVALVIIGPIRQEILCGISDSQRFEDLKAKLSVFEDFKMETADYERAAEYYNECRKNGIQGSHIDFLICAVATNNHFSILTLDKDFEQYQKYIPITLRKIG